MAKNGMNQVQNKKLQNKTLIASPSTNGIQSINFEINSSGIGQRGTYSNINNRFSLSSQSNTAEIAQQSLQAQLLKQQFQTVSGGIKPGSDIRQEEPEVERPVQNSPGTSTEDEEEQLNIMNKQETDQFVNPQNQLNKRQYNAQKEKNQNVLTTTGPRITFFGQKNSRQSHLQNNRPSISSNNQVNLRSNSPKVTQIFLDKQYNLHKQYAAQQIRISGVSSSKIRQSPSQKKDQNKVTNMMMLSSSQSALSLAYGHYRTQSKMGIQPISKNVAGFASNYMTQPAPQKNRPSLNPNQKSSKELHTSQSTAALSLGGGITAQVSTPHPVNKSYKIFGQTSQTGTKQPRLQMHQQLSRNQVVKPNSSQQISGNSTFQKNSSLQNILKNGQQQQVNSIKDLRLSSKIKNIHTESRQNTSMNASIMQTKNKNTTFGRSDSYSILYKNNNHPFEYNPRVPKTVLNLGPTQHMQQKIKPKGDGSLRSSGSKSSREGQSYLINPQNNEKYPNIFFQNIDHTNEESRPLKKNKSVDGLLSQNLIKQKIAGSISARQQNQSKVGRHSPSIENLVIGHKVKIFSPKSQNSHLSQSSLEKRKNTRPFSIDFEIKNLNIPDTNQFLKPKKSARGVSKSGLILAGAKPGQANRNQVKTSRRTNRSPVIYQNQNLIYNLQMEQHEKSNQNYILPSQQAPKKIKQTSLCKPQRKKSKSSNKNEKNEITKIKEVLKPNDQQQMDRLRSYSPRVNLNDLSSRPMIPLPPNRLASSRSHKNGYHTNQSQEINKQLANKYKTGTAQTISRTMYEIKNPNYTDCSIDKVNVICCPRDNQLKVKAIDPEVWYNENILRKLVSADSEENSLKIQQEVLGILQSNISLADRCLSLPIFPIFLPNVSKQTNLVDTQEHPLAYGTILQYVCASPYPYEELLDFLLFTKANVFDKTQNLQVYDSSGNLTGSFTLLNLACAQIKMATIEKLLRAGIEMSTLKTSTHQNSQNFPNGSQANMSQDSQGPAPTTTKQLQFETGSSHAISQNNINTSINQQTYMAESGSTQNLIDRIANLNIEDQKAKQQQEKSQASICKSSDQINESPLRQTNGQAKIQKSQSQSKYQNKRPSSSSSNEDENILQGEIDEFNEHSVQKKQDESQPGSVVKTTPCMASIYRRFQDGGEFSYSKQKTLQPNIQQSPILTQSAQQACRLDSVRSGIINMKSRKSDEGNPRAIHLELDPMNNCIKEGKSDSGCLEKVTQKAEGNQRQSMNMEDLVSHQVMSAQSHTEWKHNQRSDILQEEFPIDDLQVNNTEQLAKSKISTNLQKRFVNVGELSEDEIKNHSITLVSSPPEKPQQSQILTHSNTLKTPKEFNKIYYQKQQTSHNLSNQQQQSRVDKKNSSNNSNLLKSKTKSVKTSYPSGQKNENSVQKKLEQSTTKIKPSEKSNKDCDIPDSACNSGGQEMRKVTKESLKKINKIHDFQEIVIGPDCFIAHQLLGTGSFGEVFLVEEKSTKRLMAMKVLQKKKIEEQKLLKYAFAEKQIMAEMTAEKHPFIVKIHYTFQTHENLYILMQFCAGGDLSQYLELEGSFSETKARFYICEIILALEALHSKNIIFRDLKPDNIVLDEQGHAMLTDFGLSRQEVRFQTAGADSFCGSYAYLAPEMLKKKGHGKAVDWYLIGVVLYELLTGLPPYYDDDKETLFKNITNNSLEFPSTSEVILTDACKDLLQKLLEKDPTRRLGIKNGIKDIKEHIFFQGVDWEKVARKEVFDMPKAYLAEMALSIIQKQPYVLKDHPKTKGEVSKEGDIGHIAGWEWYEN